MEHDRATGAESEPSRSAEVPRHRDYVGRPDAFDTLGASHFTLLTTLGLREHHRLLDFGCGSLRSGRLCIPYLQKGHYYGVEPNRWLVDDAIEQETGKEIIRLKAPTFREDSDFVLTRFDQRFDYIHAHSILTHSAKWMMERLFEQIRLVLQPSGLFVGTLNLGKTDHSGDEWFYPGHVSYRWTTVRDLARKNKLTAYRLAWPHPSQRYLLLLHQDVDLRTFLGSTNREHLLPIESRVTELSPLRAIWSRLKS